METKDSSSRNSRYVYLVLYDTLRVGEEDYIFMVKNHIANPKILALDLKLCGYETYYEWKDVYITEADDTHSIDIDIVRVTKEELTEISILTYNNFYVARDVRIANINCKMFILEELH